MIEATESTFDQMARTAGTVLVEFTSSTCAPCRMMRKTLEQVSSVTVLQVDVKRCPGITRRFAIASVPTMILLRGGTETRRQVGLMSLQSIQAFIS